MASITITGYFQIHPTTKTPGWIYVFPVSDFYIGETAYTASSPYDGGLPLKKIAVNATLGTGAYTGTTLYDFALILQSTTDATVNPVTARYGMFIFDNADVPQLICPVSELASFWLEPTPTTINLYDLRNAQGDTPDFPVSGGDATVTGNLIVTGSAAIGTSLSVGTTLSVAGATSLQSYLRFMSGATPWFRVESTALNQLKVEKGDGTLIWTLDATGNSAIVPENALSALGSSTKTFGVLHINYSGGVVWRDGATVHASMQATLASLLSVHGTDGAGGGLQLRPITTTPANPSSSAEMNIYFKSGKIIFQYNDAGTTRWKSLDLTGTGVTWVAATSAP